MTSRGSSRRAVWPGPPSITGTWGGVRAVAGLPHRDPFDRLLVAQAAVEGLVLVTADDVLLGAELDGVAVRDARA